MAHYCFFFVAIHCLALCVTLHDPYDQKIRAIAVSDEKSKGYTIDMTTTIY